MPKANSQQYRVSRAYNNRYGLDMLVRKLVRQHISSTYTLEKPQMQSAYREDGRVGKESD